MRTGAIKAGETFRPLLFQQGGNKMNALNRQFTLFVLLTALLFLDRTSYADGKSTGKAVNCDGVVHGAG